MSYPSWRYHEKEEPKIIHSKDEEHKDWKDSPAYFEKQADEQAPAEDEKPEVKEVKPKKKKQV